LPIETADQFVVALGRAGVKDVSYWETVPLKNLGVYR